MSNSSLFLLTTFLGFGCTQARFFNEKKYTTLNTLHTKKIHKSVTKDFYLFGLLPGTHTIRPEDVFPKESELSSLSFERNRTQSDWLWMFFTLGFYVPTTYHVEAMTKN